MLIEAKKGMVERQRSDVSRRRRAVQAAFEAEISENRSARGDGCDGLCLHGLRLHHRRLHHRSLECEPGGERARGHGM